MADISTSFARGARARDLGEGRDGEAALPALSWQAVVGGALAAASVTLLLVALGSGFGFASVSPWPSGGAGAGTFAIATAIWLIAAQWVSAGIGGYLAGRLRHDWPGAHSHEVFFRDTAHGFLSWALAALVGAVALASVAGSLASGGARIAESAGGMAVQAAAQDGFVDRLFRGPATAAPADPAGRAEAARILAEALSTGTLPDEDKTYLAQMIATRTGLPAADAAKRIDDVVAQAKAAAEKLRVAANEARKAAATLSFYLFFSMLIGAFIASVAGAIGGGQRDDFVARPL